MKDQEKSKTQLIDELVRLRQRVAQLEGAECINATGKTLRALGIDCVGLLDEINDGVYVLDDQGYFVFVNKVIERRTGMPFEQCVGMHISQSSDAR